MSEGSKTPPNSNGRPRPVPLSSIGYSNGSAASPAPPRVTPAHLVGGVLERARVYQEQTRKLEQPSYMMVLLQAAGACVEAGVERERASLERVLSLETQLEWAEKERERGARAVRRRRRRLEREEKLRDERAAVLEAYKRILSASVEEKDARDAKLAASGETEASKVSESSSYASEKEE